MEMNTSDVCVILTWLESRIKEVSVDGLTFAEKHTITKIVASNEELMTILMSNKKKESMDYLFDWAKNLPKGVKEQITGRTL